MSSYQSLKLVLVEIFNIPREGFHFILGFLVFLAGAYLFKIKLSSYKTLIIPSIFAFILELLDLRDALAYGFSFNALNSFTDILTTMSLPTLTVLYMRHKNR